MQNDLGKVEDRVPYYSTGMFGFTDDEARMESVRQYVRDAITDGWTIEPTYTTESVERAAHLKREGFVMSVLTRDNRDRKSKCPYETSISIWGPDGLAISVPSVYDFAEIQRRIRVCSACGKSDIDTERYSFAGRCCAECLPAMRAKHEKPGWCD